MKSLFAVVSAGLCLAAYSGSAVAFCTNPNALGISRVLSLDTSKGLEVGRNEFHHTLPLQPKEVVLTFDDGPHPGTTEVVLKALEDQCTRATFFIIGNSATAHPELLLTEEAAGETIGTHTLDHPLDLRQRPAEDGIKEIDGGIRAVSAALGHSPAPFFRFPGLADTPDLRTYLAQRHVGIFSIDAEGGDWRHDATPDKIRARAMAQLRSTNGGILLLHDTKQATAEMLPDLLKDLQAEGFKIVQVVAAPDDGSVVATVPSIRVLPRQAVRSAVGTVTPPATSAKGGGIKSSPLRLPFVLPPQPSLGFP